MIEGETCREDHQDVQHVGVLLTRRTNEYVKRSHRHREIQFPLAMMEEQEFYLRQDRHFAKQTSSTFDRFMRGETLLYSGSMMLISFVTFWMSLIFVILAGSILISIYSLILAASFGHKMQKWARSMRRSIA